MLMLNTCKRAISTKQVKTVLQKMKYVKEHHKSELEKLRNKVLEIRRELEKKR